MPAPGHPAYYSSVNQPGTNMPQPGQDQAQPMPMTPQQQFLERWGTPHFLAARNAMMGQMGGGGGATIQPMNQAPSMAAPGFFGNVAGGGGAPAYQPLQTGAYQGSGMAGTPQYGMGQSAWPYQMGQSAII